MTLLEHLQLCREYRGIWAESKSDTYGYLFGEAIESQKNVSLDAQVKHLFANELEKIADEKFKEYVNNIPPQQNQEPSIRAAIINNCARFVSDVPEEICKGFVEIVNNMMRGKILQNGMSFSDMFDKMIMLKKNDLVENYEIIYVPKIIKEFDLQDKNKSDSAALDNFKITLRREVGVKFTKGVKVAQNKFGSISLTKAKSTERKFIVNQEYSYNTFIRDFVELRCELRQAWYYREKFEEKGVDYDNAKTNEEKSSIQKELFKIAAKEDKCYDKAKKIALQAIDRYWDLHKPSTKNLVATEKKIKDKQGNVLYIIQKDASGRIVLPIGESFYPFMFEVYFRSHTPFDIAFDKGRGLQAKAKKERDIRERLILPDAEEERKRVAEYLDKTTNEFRNFKDRLALSEEDHMTPKLRAHMEGGYYEMFNQKYPEAFEMLSRSSDKWDWDKIITDCLYRYTHYIEWANEHREYGKIMQSTKVRKEFDQHNAQSILATGDINTPELKAALKKYEGK